MHTAIGCKMLIFNARDIEKILLIIIICNIILLVVNRAPGTYYWSRGPDYLQTVGNDFHPLPYMRYLLKCRSMFQNV